MDAADVTKIVSPDGLEAQLGRAERLCADRRLKLTALRRQVLELVLASDVPRGAYDLLEQLRVHHPGAAPPTVYRALDFLLEQRLIHRIERLSAFVACRHAFACTHGDACYHSAQFLICTRCRAVTEIEAPEVSTGLDLAAARAGFALKHATVEAEGICALCAEEQDVG